MSLLRSKTFFAAIILALGGLTAASSANAQFSPGMVMRATMPTSFIVGGKMMPAGRYQLRRLGTSASAEPNQLLITDNHGNSAMIVGQAGELSSSPASSDALVLKRIGGEYYLSNILYSGQFTGVTIPLPNAHREYLGRNNGSDRVVITMTAE
jgi:hypothetical protein